MYCVYEKKVECFEKILLKHSKLFFINTIHKTLSKSGSENFIIEKNKTLLKFLKKTGFFSKSLMVSNDGGTFHLNFWNLHKIWI